MKIENACVLEESAKPSTNAIWKELSVPCSWGFKCYYFYASIRVIQEVAKKKKKKSDSIVMNSKGTGKFVGLFCLPVSNSPEYGKKGVFVGTVHLKL